MNNLAQKQSNVINFPVQQAKPILPELPDRVDFNELLTSGILNPRCGHIDGGYAIVEEVNGKQEIVWEIYRV